MQLIVLTEKLIYWGAWVAQSVNLPTLVQVMISRFMSSSPIWGSVLTAHSLQPASGSVFPALSAPPLLTLSLSLKMKYTLKKMFFKEKLIY